MKDLVRLRTSLKEEVENILNEQVKLEALASSRYLAMAAWCDRNGYANSADFFFEQAEEEREHMLKIFKYISDMGGTAVSPEVTGIQQEFASFREVFETALEHEVGVSQAINRVVDVCRKMHDYSTEKFMGWFLAEQTEEEFVARRAVELFDVIGEEGVGRFLIDQEIPKIEYKKG